MIILFVQLFWIPAYCQNPHEETSEAERVSKHHISIMIGHTHVPKGFEDVDKSAALIVPSWGLNYNFKFNERWSIGWHNDMEISTYKISDEDGMELERERPVITAIVGMYRPWELVGLELGFGREFERHRSFWVIRTAIEFEIKINSLWNLSPALAYDIKESVYDSWSLGLGVERHF